MRRSEPSLSGSEHFLGMLNPDQYVVIRKVYSTAWHSSICMLYLWNMTTSWPTSTFKFGKFIHFLWQKGRIRQRRSDQILIHNNKHLVTIVSSYATIVCTGPDPNNIVLILRTQSILFDRHSEELQPYKYAGYPMLIKVRHLCTPDSTVLKGIYHIYVQKSIPWLDEPIIDSESLKRFVQCGFYFVLYHHITVHNKTDSKTDSESQHKLLFLGLPVFNLTAHHAFCANWSQQTLLIRIL
jgi:hypothetical protein